MLLSCHIVARKKPACVSNPKGVSAAQRARDFNEKLITVKLFSFACREELLVAKNHVQSAKYTQRKKQVARSKNRKREVTDALKVYEQEAHPMQWLDASRGSQAIPCEGIDSSHRQLSIG